MAENTQYTGLESEVQGADGKRVFRAGLVPTLVTAALAPALLGLGVWQLQRAEEKRQLYAGFERQDAVSLAELADAGLEAMRYRRISIHGHYDDQHQFLLDNMTHRGQPGYHVLTPLHAAGGGAPVLVNRGWVAPTESRESLPAIETPASPQLIRGRVDALPRPGLRLRAEPPIPGTPWPRLVQFPEIGDLEEALGYDLAPFIVLLEPEAAGGYAREWQPREFTPERHLGYAVTWFALAATLLVIYVAVNFRRPKHS